MKLSIITINYNNANGLIATIRSVLSQTVKEFEFIVIDGGSSDNSKKIIEEYSNQFTYSISEKDGGIYDAMNKGILKSNGDYCLFLNSGDTFYDTSVVEVFYKHIQTNSQFEIIYGNSLQTGLGEPFLYKQNFNLDYDFWYLKTLNHQAVFIKRKLFEEFGLYSTNFKIASDFEFFLKVFVKKPNTFQYMNHTVCNYDSTGMSSSSEIQQIHQIEKDKILKSILPVSIYKQTRMNYRKTLPLKERLLDFIHENPFLSKLYYLIYKRFKSS